MLNCYFLSLINVVNLYFSFRTGPGAPTVFNTVRIPNHYHCLFIYSLYNLFWLVIAFVLSLKFACVNSNL